MQSASIPDVRNMMDIASGVARFFNNSPKRQLALDKFIEDLHKREQDSSKRQKLKELCKTRWVERHNAFETFLELFEPTVQCLEEIVEPTSRQLWNRKTISDASSHLRALTEFKFIATLTVSKNLLAYIKGLSVKLQGKWQDVSRAYNNIEAVIKQLQDVRSKVEEFHSKWFDEAKTLASKVNVEPSIPRRACHQAHRANTQVNIINVQ